MTEFFCKDCDSFMIHGECITKETLRDRYGDICSSFVTKDGKRPRFCRLASSVDEMAEALIHYMPLGGLWILWKGHNFSDFYKTKAEALADAKAWLLEVKK